MCGLVGVSLGSPCDPANTDLLEAAMLLQHRGQDACGIICGSIDGSVDFHKGVGLVTDVFDSKVQSVPDLRGSFGIAHGMRAPAVVKKQKNLTTPVRYATNGKYGDTQIQPLIADRQDNIAIAHNGNLVNTPLLSNGPFSSDPSESYTSGDSEFIMATILSAKLHSRTKSVSKVIPGWILSGIKRVYTQCIGSFACLLFIPQCGIIAFRDANGIKPMIMAQRVMDNGEVDYMFASESVACIGLGYTPLRDLKPGELVFVSSYPQHKGYPRIKSQQVVPEISYSPDIFEYVYFARTESIIDGISVNKSRRYMGEALARSLVSELDTSDDIDCVIPVPETSFPCALAVSQFLQRPLALGLVRNRYTSRTFLLPTQHQRFKAVARKLSAVREEFEGKNVLIVDDSIVRGTTATHIVRLARDSGAKKVYFASGSPVIRFNHIHGIDLAEEKRLIAYGRSNLEIANAMGADGVFYLPLDGLIEACIRARCTGDVSSFEVGVFNGIYTTGLPCVDGHLSLR